MSHGDVVKIIKESGLTVQLTVSNCITNPRPSDFISEIDPSPFNANISNALNSFPMLT